jgi:uncharacterized protein YjbJ (UPF0337 family)
MRGKMARSAAHPPFPTVHVAAAVRATACLAKTPENRKNSHWFGGSYGESRLRSLKQRGYSNGQRSNQGSAQQAKGAVKEAAGKVFGDKKLETEGKADKAAGKVQNAIGGLKDAVRGK